MWGRFFGGATTASLAYCAYAASTPPYPSSATEIPRGGDHGNCGDSFSNPITVKNDTSAATLSALPLADAPPEGVILHIALNGISARDSTARFDFQVGGHGVGNDRDGTIDMYGGGCSHATP